MTKPDIEQNLSHRTERARLPPHLIAVSHWQLMAKALVEGMSALRCNVSTPIKHSLERTIRGAHNSLEGFYSSRAQGRPQSRLNRASRAGQSVSGHLYRIWDSWSVISKLSASGQMPRSNALLAAILASSTAPSKITNHEAGQPPRSLGLAKISIRSCPGFNGGMAYPKAEGSEERRRAARGSASQSVDA